MDRKLLRTVSPVFISLPLVFALWGCSKPATEPVSESSTAQPTQQTSPLTGFEKDLKYIKDGQYTYIWVFSRKDGKPLDKDDGAFLRTTAPQVVDWVTTDEGKKVIAGTNFNLEEGNLNLLKKRFNAENYSGK